MQARSITDVAAHSFSEAERANGMKHRSYDQREARMKKKTGHSGGQQQVSNKKHNPKTNTQNPANGFYELIWMAAMVTSIKLLLIPSYRSTDFEVHRHWLAITHSLPFTEWYFNETSRWTLDYPPFFAWFEKLLSVFASRIDPQITHLENGLNYDAITVIVFQRVTVMVADLVLYWGLWRCCRNLDLGRQRLVYVCVAWSPILLIVDHIHFQYNGFLLGILLLSLSLIMEGNDLLGGLVFAVLVCFKHLFAVAGPIYFVYLLRHYCRGRFAVIRFAAMGSSVMFVLGLAFGPFLYYGQISQVLKRLFPFGRGLCHAYWAPNVWALYNIFDKFLAILLSRLGFNIHTGKAHLTGGLIGDSSTYAVLPQITPFSSLILVSLALFPCVVQIWRYPNQQQFAKWVSYAYACGFMFGWHVHEKASLHFVIPLALVAICNLEHAGHYIFLSIVSCYSMFPLLYEAKEYTIKVMLLAIHAVLMWRSFSLYFSNHSIKEQVKDSKGSNQIQLKRKSLFLQLQTVFCSRDTSDIVGTLGQIYLVGLVICEIFASFLHPYILNEKLPFLPLMLQSVYCAFGMVLSFLFQVSHICI